MLRKLVNKTINNPDATEGAVLTGLLASIYPIMLPIVAGMAAIDATIIAGKLVGKGAVSIASATGSVSAGIRKLATSRHSRNYPGSVVLQQKVSREDPLDRAEQEYVALQQRICKMPFDDKDKQALHNAAEIRFLLALKEQISGQ